MGRYGFAISPLLIRLLNSVGLQSVVGSTGRQTLSGPPLTPWFRGKPAVWAVRGFQQTLQRPLILPLTSPISEPASRTGDAASIRSIAARHSSSHRRSATRRSAKLAGRKPEDGLAFVQKNGAGCRFSGNQTERRFQPSARSLRHRTLGKAAGEHGDQTGWDHSGRADSPIAGGGFGCRTDAAALGFASSSHQTSPVRSGDGDKRYPASGLGANALGHFAQQPVGGCCRGRSAAASRRPASEFG